MKRISFNDNWIYNGSPVTLPHDAMFNEKRDPDAACGSAGAFFPGGRYVYEKKFEKPEAEHAVLHFEGVYKNSRVYINDKLAGGAAYGYIPFFVDLDDYLIDGKNVIRVECEVEHPDSRWYSGAGIYRPVWLWTGVENSILPLSVKISTVSYDPAVIHVESPQIVKVSIPSSDGTEFSGEGRSFDLEMTGAKLWSEDSPFLYTAHVTNGSDSDEVRFGIRKIEWSSSGLKINGRNTFLRGGCIHHDNGVIGAREFDESAFRKIRKLKECGFNAIRSAHNPCSEAVMKACDELGVYIMDETWDMWYRKKNRYDYANQFNDHYRDDIEQIVKKDFNHPSVIMYSIGNEVSEPAEEKGVALAREMTQLLHDLDPGRPVTGGFNLMIIGNASKGKQMYSDDGGLNSGGDEKASGMNSTMFNLITSMVGSGMNKAANSSKTDKAVSPVLDTVDIAGYNYASGRYRKEGKLHPERLIIGSETFPQDIAKNWKMVEELPYLAGDFMWTAWDYIGEAGIGAWSWHSDAKGFNKPYPWLLADTGAFDILGNPTGEALWAKAVWQEGVEPLIAVRPANHKGERLIKAAWRGTNGILSWSFRGCEGNKTVVEVFTRAPKAELVLNGKKIGIKKTKDCRAVFAMKYKSGVLTAYALDDDCNRLAETELVSANQAILRMHPEKAGVRPGEVIYVDINFEDANGVVESNMDRSITLNVTGGELLGFGSADPRTEDRYDSGLYSSYYGRSQAVIRATVPGDIKITANCLGNSCEAVITCLDS